MTWAFQVLRVWKDSLDLLEFLDNLAPQDYLDRKEIKVILVFQALAFQVVLAQRVNLVCLEPQGTQVSKVLWELLVCLDYQEHLGQKDNLVFLGSQEPQAFLDQRESVVLLGILAFPENLVL